MTFEDVMRRRKKTKEQKNRKNTYRYYLPLVKRRLEVCKKFFLAVTGLSEKVVHMNAKRLVKEDALPRGKFGRGKEANRKFLENFFDSIAKAPSHYRRKYTKKI